MGISKLGVPRGSGGPARKRLRLVERTRPSSKAARGWLVEESPSLCTLLSWPSGDHPPAEGEASRCSQTCGRRRRESSQLGCAQLSLPHAQLSLSHRPCLPRFAAPGQGAPNGMAMYKALVMNSTAVAMDPAVLFGEMSPYLIAARRRGNQARV